MNGQDESTKGLKAAFDNMSEREQNLLKIMLGIFAVLGLVLVIGLAQRSVADLEQQTQQQQVILDLLATEGPAFAAAQAGGASDDPMTRADLFTDDVLRDNPVQFHSFVDTHAAAVGLTVSSYGSDEHPLGSGRSGEDEGPMIIERQMRVDLRNADMDRLIEFLHRVEESSEPVVIKRIDIRSVQDEGQVRALIVMSTFQYGEQEES